MAQFDPKLIKKALWVAAGIVLLAAVIFVGGALSGAPDDQTRVTKGGGDEAARLVADADRALSRNETETAVGLARRALKLDPDNAGASAVIARVAGAQQAAQKTPEKKPEPKPGADDAFMTAYDDLQELLPGEIDGWNRGQVSGDSPDTLVTYAPLAGSELDGQIVRSVISVHDMKTATGATKFLDKVDKVAYPDDAAPAAVGVVADAYFGTDGASGAMVAFTRGRYSFEVLVVAEPEVAPSTLQSVALELAGRLPAAK